MRRVLVTLTVLATLALPAAARADQPVVTTERVAFAITIPADQNPCGFDLVFTGLGDVTVITFSDGRQTSHGILQHTISSPWHTLSSIGPASVHTDLGTGISTDTGMEFSFHQPGAGVVFAQAGNFTFLPDGTVIEHGLDRFDPALCLALAPQGPGDDAVAASPRALGETALTVSSDIPEHWPTPTGNSRSRAQSSWPPGRAAEGS